MDAELELELAKDFPFMRINASPETQTSNGGIYDSYDSFFCDVCDGWYSVLYGLCQELTEVYEKAGVPVDIVPVQIKKKFGELCFYFETSNANPSLNKIVDEIVDKWEDKSTEVCEKCGKSGELRFDLSWVLTLCDNCYEQEKSKYVK